MNDEDRAFINDEYDSDPISRRNRNRPRARTGKALPPIAIAKVVADKPRSLKLRKEVSTVRIDSSSSDEMSGIESPTQGKEPSKSDDDEMSGIESVGDVESVSAQLDEAPVRSPAIGRSRPALDSIAQQNSIQIARSPSHALEDPDTEMLDHDKYENQNPEDIPPAEDSQVYYTAPDPDYDEIYYTAPDHAVNSQPGPQQNAHPQNVGTSDDHNSSADESDDDGLGLERYVRRPVGPEVTLVPQTFKRSEEVKFDQHDHSLDNLYSQGSEYEDDGECESIRAA